jgi:hypothetical protein
VEIAFYMAMRSWATLEFDSNIVEDIFFSGRFGISNKQNAALASS